jgi:hypothetical protein
MIFIYRKCLHNFTLKLIDIKSFETYTANFAVKLIELSAYKRNLKENEF